MRRPLWCQFSAKKVDQSIPLWVLFLAVQFLDVLWVPFILLGIEKVSSAGFAGASCSGGRRVSRRRSFSILSYTLSGLAIVAASWVTYAYLAFVSTGT